MNTWPVHPESEDILKEIEHYVQQKLKKAAQKHDQEGVFPHEVIQELSSMGLMGMMVPEEFGGAGLSAVTYAQVIESIASGCASTAVILSVNNSLVCDPILKYGTLEQKKAFLKPLATGEKIGAFALSEPNHGSDPAGLECAAVKTEGGYVISGAKNWITNGKEASTILVFATLNRSLGHKGICAFLVDSKAPGFVVAKIEHKLGIKASSTAQLFFDQVFVPQSALLGKEGEGLKIALSTLDGGRIGIAAQALGIGKAALEESVRFARERKQFGSPIAKLQAIQWFLADMSVKLQSARLLTWDAATKKDLHERFTEQAAMAKLAASEAAMWVATKAIQIHGGYGYTTEYPVERYFRDAKITEIYEGTSEIQRLVIASCYLKDIA